MANRNFPNGGKLYSFNTKPVSITCNFIVDSANGNGNGIRSLKGSGVANVFMHTSATPLNGNPNPAAGYIMVQLEDNYNRAIIGANSLVSPLSSTQTTTTAGSAYVITSLGTATLAQWKAAGLPNGITPALGAAFIATATGTIGGSATVAPPTTSNITDIETVGDINQTIAPTGTPGLGAVIILQCLKNAALTAPADGTVIALEFKMDDSSVTVQKASPGN